MTAYTSPLATLPNDSPGYQNGDTLTLGDGTKWVYYEAAGWVPAAPPGKTPFFGSETGGLSPESLAALAGSGVASKTIVTLIAAYEAQQAVDLVNGPRLLARASLPVAADVPTLTASATAPGSDTDAAAQVIYPFGTNSLTDPIALNLMQEKRWYRGYSAGLRGRTYGSSLRLASTVSAYGQNASQDLDSALGYGIDTALVTFDAILDSDVLFMDGQGDANTQFEVYVNGSLVTAAPGSGLTQVNSRAYTPTARYVKLKWGTVARRRVQIVFLKPQATGAFYTRNISTITPATSPFTWLHNGDSFSQYTGASSFTMGLASWLHAAFGYQFDFVNIAQGSTSLAGTTMNLPGATPVTNQKASQRQQYLLHARANNNVRVASYLIGHNDAGKDQALVASELIALMKQTAADYPGVLQVVFASNASPGIIASGAVVTVENTIKAAAASIPGVIVIPLQTASEGAFLRGTGKVGATTGDGNADLYTGTDGTHPGDTGHRAYGETMARKLYEALKAAKIGA